MSAPPPMNQQTEAMTAILGQPLRCTVIPSHTLTIVRLVKRLPNWHSFDPRRASRQWRNLAKRYLKPAIATPLLGMESDPCRKQFRSALLLSVFEGQVLPRRDVSTRPASVDQIILVLGRRGQISQIDSDMIQIHFTNANFDVRSIATKR